MNRNGLPAVTSREETGLSVREEHSSELSIARQVAQAQHEVQSAITVAIKFPRNEDDSFGRLMKSCKRESFAGLAAYSFPRGGSKVTGPSAHLAREAARVWGNIQYGFEIIRDDDESIHLRGWAWDMQTNSKATQDAAFKKAVQRKIGGETRWVKPDERDLRELINKHGAIAERNCVLKILPKDLIEDAMNEAVRTLRDGVKRDLDGERKKMVAAFAELNVSVPDLEQYLGCPLKHANPEQVTELRTIWRSIMDGNTTWPEYVRRDEKPAEPSHVPKEGSVDDLLGGQEAPEPAYEKPSRAMLGAFALKKGCPENELDAWLDKAMDLDKPEIFISDCPWVRDEPPKKTRKSPAQDAVSAVQDILDAIQEAVAAGDVAAVNAIYDRECGPDGGLTEAQSAVVTDAVNKARDGLAKKPGKRSQSQLLDTHENTGTP